MDYNFSLKAYNTFGFDCKALQYTALNNEGELDDLLPMISAQDLPVLILGGGSNLLFTRNFDGLVIHNKIMGIELLAENNLYFTVKVGAGETWHNFVLHAIENSWGGIENLSLIPGTVGASPIQNIGAYGVEVKDVIESVEAIDMRNGSKAVFSNKECEFGYRDSIFKKRLKGKYIITSVTYRLTKQHQMSYQYGAIMDVLKQKNITVPNIKDISDAVISIRKSKLPDPKEIGNAGSFFKNPEISKTHFDKLTEQYPNIVGYPIGEHTIKVPAGWLIDNAEWKGKTFGKVGVHKNQALVLVNYGGGEGYEIKKLSQRIQQDVLKKYDISLEIEVNIL